MSAEVSFILGSSAVRVTLGPNGATPTTVESGFDRSDRPQRKAFLTWKGTPLLGMTIDIRFDHWLDRGSAEAQIALLESFAIGKAGAQPLPIRIAGPVPYKGQQWIIDSIDWESAMRRPGDMARIRQHATVTVVEWVPADMRIVKAATPAKTAKRTQWIVKKGENLMIISAKVYGTSKRWQDIAKKNKIKGGARAVKVGQKLKLP